ncbi:hypothetical protein QF046_002733 [Microbacterium sp. W4I4]|uniref:glycoside hydrolase family 36 N-terminal domain-containing protein n=1 Tax=Microbacterium sp. W4I4 TaxID=3042295 RepID=UPI00278019FB|nr:glycoside hydrolase family 36 N-terminal domain-containing protein [Microbacterium sp. W4I4]MDQ0615092.1 hypothetical protein [Microbacterium sp. W4I4]
MTSVMFASDPVAEQQQAIGAFRVCWDGTSPAALLSDLAGIGRSDVGLVEIFSAAEQRARTSQAHVRSAIGSRLRVRRFEHGEDRGADVLTVIQRDDETGVEVSTSLRAVPHARAVRIHHVVRNAGAHPIVLTAVSSATISFGRRESDIDSARLLTARSEWLAEDRWEQRPLRDALPQLSLPIHGQDGRGRYSIASHGSWSTGEHLPVGVLISSDAADAGALTWQIETSAGWCVDMSQGEGGAVMSFLGPTDLEHQFAHALAPGEGFRTEAVALAAADGGADAALTELTHYRRSIRSESADAGLPIVYNDFMNTLMGQPSTQALVPLIDAAGGVRCGDLLHRCRLVRRTGAGRLVVDGR